MGGGGVAVGEHYNASQILMAKPYIARLRISHRRYIACAKHKYRESHSVRKVTHNGRRPLILHSSFCTLHFDFECSLKVKLVLVLPSENLKNFIKKLFVGDALIGFTL